MKVRIEINGEEIYSVEIANRGMPKEAKCGDLRLYSWTDSRGVNGVVSHHRSDGATVLASKVLGRARL